MVHGACCTLHVACSSIIAAEQESLAISALIDAILDEASHQLGRRVRVHQEGPGSFLLVTVKSGGVDDHWAGVGGGTPKLHFDYPHKESHRATVVVNIGGFIWPGEGAPPLDSSCFDCCPSLPGAL